MVGSATANVVQALVPARRRQNSAMVREECACLHFLETAALSDGDGDVIYEEAFEPTLILMWS